jgi:hypothetical protein
VPTEAGGVLPETVPVNPLSLNRPMSELHPAMPAEMTATAARRDVTRVLEDTTKKAIVGHSHATVYLSNK